MNPESLSLNEQAPVLPAAYSQLYRTMPVAVGLFDLGGAVIDSNNAFLELFGLSSLVALKNVNLFSHFNMPDIDCVNLHEKKHIQYDTTLDFTSFDSSGVCSSSKKDVLFVRLSAEAVCDSGCTVCGYICTIQDNSCLVKMKQMLEVHDERWKYVLDESGDGLWDWNVVTGKIFYSHQWKKMLGYGENEISDTVDEWMSRIHPDDLEQVQEQLKKHIENNDACYISEHRLRCKDGKYKWVIDRGKILSRGPDGNPLRIIGTHIDISEKKRMAEALWESENLYRNLFDHHIVIKLVIDPADGQIIDANAAAADFYGWTLDQLKKRKIQDINVLPPELIMAEMASAMERKISHFEFKHRLANGAIRDVEVFSSRVEANGRTYLHSIVHDITVRKQYEDEIKLNDARLESLLRISQHQTENVQEFLDFTLDEAIKLTGSKFGFIGSYKEDAKEFELDTWSRGLLKRCDDREQMVFGLDETGLLGDAVRQRGPVVVNDFNTLEESRKKLPDGLEAPKKFMTLPVFFDDKIVAVIGVSDKETDYNDSDVRQLSIMMDVVWKMVDRKNSEETRQILVDMLDNAPSAITVYGQDGKCLYANKKACTLHGYEKDEFMKLPLSNLDAPESLVDASERARFIDEHGEASFEVWHYNKNAVAFPLEMFVKKMQWLGTPAILSIATDISGRKAEAIERERFNNQINQMKKLKSLGVLAGGIAHDFNNLLGGIFGYIDIARESSKDPEIVDYLLKASESIERARRLTQQLLTFAKGGAPVKEVGPLFPFVEETARAVLGAAPVSCAFTVADDLWECNFDKGQIAQVVENVVLNAVQAMPGGGRIEIAAKNVDLKNDVISGLSPGKYIRIAISDSGDGISEEVLSHIFDPFFTTKPKGHGLGLTTSFSIVSRHGGCIDVESESGCGSIFYIYLPAFVSAEAAVTKVSDAVQGLSGTIVVMDDEKIIRDITGALLETLGFKAVCVTNGREAVEFLAAEMKAKRKVAAMIFDLTVPGGMGGKEAIVEIRKLSQEIPVYVASGYADDPVMANPAEYGFTASICKPFSRNELAEMLGVEEKRMRPADRRHAGDDRRAG